MPRAPRLIAVAALALAGGCSEIVDLLPTADLASAGGGEAPDLPPPSGPDLRLTANGDMAGSSVPIHLGDPASPLSCAASLASAGLRQALCACALFDPGGALVTSATDSSGASSDLMLASAASVAGNGDITLTPPSTIAGSLYTVDALFTARGAGSSRIDKTLLVDGTLSLGSELVVGGDAWIGGAINRAGNPFTVKGRTHVGGGGEHDGGDDGEDFPQLGTPCLCDPTRVPIAAQVALAKGSNDNARAKVGPDGPLRPDHLELMTPTTVTLPAGRYYVTGIRASANLTLHAQGPVALFVDGEVGLSGSAGLPVQLDPGASLDLVIAGNLTAAGGDLGSADASEQPAQVRLWSSGALLSFPSAITVRAALTAPGARLSAPAGLTLHGAALVASAQLAPGKGLTIVYDRALLSIGTKACKTPANPPLL